MPYKLFDHTADIGILIEEENTESAFTTAALAIFQLMTPDFKGQGVEKNIRISAPDLERLLVEFLSELLYLFEVEGFVALEASVSISGNRLEAVLAGGTFAPGKDVLEMQIKAVTYHMLSVEGGKITVILDI